VVAVSFADEVIIDLEMRAAFGIAALQ